MSTIPLRKRLSLAASRQVPRRLNRLYYSRRGDEPYNTAGVDVFRRHWDNLVILDACRYDTFADVATNMPGTLHCRQSRGSTTNEWMAANVDGRWLTETVYVSASPSIRDASLDTKCAAIVDVWRDGWDSDLGTVPPNAVTKAAQEAHEQYPHKRLVVHYMQPHYPFIGDIGQAAFDYDGYDSGDADRDVKFWDTVGTRVNDVSDETIREAYRENLQVVLPHVRELLETIPGKTVVTADHGEMLGEWAKPVPHRVYGHPGRLHTPELIDVPWLVHRTGDRREIRAAGPEGIASDDTDESTVEERLQHLGYS